MKPLRSTIPVDARTPVDASSLVGRVNRGTAWAVLQGGCKHVLDLAVFLLLAKLVAPDAFGLIAMAGAVIVLFGVIADLGLGEAIVQREGLAPGHLDTAFWVTLGAGVFLATCVHVGAPWLAQAYRRPDLVPIVRSLAPLLIINAAAVVPQAILQRSFQFRELAVRSISASLAGGVTGLVLAVQGAGAWSLVAQQLVSGATGLITLCAMGRWRPSLHVSRTQAGELVRFGRHVVGAKLLNVLASKADDVIVGLVLGPVALGFYSVATRMLLALEQLFGQGVHAVALSAFSRAAGNRQEVSHLFIKTTRNAATMAFPVFGAAMYFAPQVIELTVGPRWLPSASILQVLLVAGLMHTLMHFNHAVFKASGRPEISARIAICSTTMNVLTLLVAVQFGVMAVAVSYLVRTVLIAPVGLVMVKRLLDFPVDRYLLGIAPALLGTAAAVLAASFANAKLLQVWPHPAVCIPAGLSALAVYLLALHCWPRSRTSTDRPAQPRGVPPCP